MLGSQHTDREPADPNDRHVIAAGIAAGASLILTWNLRHFPAKELKKFGLRRETPDAFLSRLYDEIPDLMIASLANARQDLTRSRVSALDFIDILGKQQLVELAKRAQKHVADSVGNLSLRKFMNAFSLCWRLREPIDPRL